MIIVKYLPEDKFNSINQQFLPIDYKPPQPKNTDFQLTSNNSIKRRKGFQVESGSQFSSGIISEKNIILSTIYRHQNNEVEIEGITTFPYYDTEGEPDSARIYYYFTIEGMDLNLTILKKMLLESIDSFIVKEKLLNIKQAPSMLKPIMPIEDISLFIEVEKILEENIFLIAIQIFYITKIVPAMEKALKDAPILKSLIEKTVNN